jgi:hypothetical protein
LVEVFRACGIEIDISDFERQHEGRKLVTTAALPGYIERLANRERPGPSEVPEGGPWQGSCDHERTIGLD